MRALFYSLGILSLLAGCHSAGLKKPQPAANPAVQTQVTERSTLSDSEPRRPRVNFHRPETWLIGYFQPDLFVRPPHNEWYQPEYDSYEPAAADVNRILEANVSGVSVLVVLGTWCPDSHREVPRFMKIINECGLQKIPVRFLGVDMDKVAPLGDYDRLGIVKVPTFIIYRDKTEAGRIIEYPSTSLEGDFADILHKKLS